MHATLAVLVLLVCTAFAQDFTCDLEYRTALMKNGVVRGQFVMSLTGGSPKMLTKLPATATREAFTELVQMNQFGGFNGALALPYTDQVVFRSGTSCACETGYFDYSQPLLNPWDKINSDLLDAFYSKDGAQVNGCDVYKKRAQLDLTNPVVAQNSLDKIKVPLTELSINPATKFPCTATWYDGRKYTFNNCQATPFTADSRRTTFQEPTGCKCGKPIDIVLVLDRSGSISVVEFQDQKKFVTDFSKQFDYDPLKANLGIVNFQARAWLHLALTQGISKANVDAAVNALGCPKSCDQGNGKNCDGNVNNCCCCCGTCISCGMRMGGDQLALGRSFAFKLLITITDGYANHLYTSAPCGNDLQLCNNDLQAAADYVYNKAGGKSKVALYAVGVGSDRDVSIDQLLMVAGNARDHVLRRSNFAELASVNVELIARSCDENVSPCGACCGFCACGKCQAPDACDPSSPCVKNAVPNGQVCCAPVPPDCTAAAAANLCSTFKCDDNPASATAGQCVGNTTVVCAPAQDPNCFDRNCVPATGLCQTQRKASCTGIVECAIGNTAACNDDNVCTLEECTPDGKCEWTNVNCDALPPNKCFVTICDKVAGCIHTSANVDCNDNNVCTNERCDNVTGCVYTNITCDDQNPCTDDLCDPINGCRHVPKTCATNVTCQIAYCNATTGQCGIRVVPCTSEFPVVAVSAGLGAAAVVGIVVAAVVAAAACAGGGAYAVVQANKVAPMAGATNNPLYKATGNSGVNPLFRG